jgi:hypothetical protein
MSYVPILISWIIMFVLGVFWRQTFSVIGKALKWMVKNERERRHGKPRSRTTKN